MDIIIFILLGIIQGIFGLLPISTAGLMSFMTKLFNYVSIPSLAVSTFLHLGTALAIIVVFRKTVLKTMIGLVNIIGGLFKNLWIYFRNNALGGSEMYVRVLGPRMNRLAAMTATAVIPAGIIGFFLRKAADYFSVNLLFIGMGFLITGVLFVVSAFVPKKEVTKNTPMYKTLIIGAITGAAVIPGISIFGVVQSIGSLSGIEKKYVQRQAVLMYVPLVIGAFVYELKQGVVKTGALGIVGIILGVLVTAAISLFAIKKVLRFVQSRDANFFALLNVIIGIIVIIFNFIFV